MGGMRWSAILPVKRLERAKTRLTPDPALRARLALAFALDTAQAAMQCEDVDQVYAVTDDSSAREALESLGVRVLADEPDDGLNAALVHGAQMVASTHPDEGVAVLSADLPCLTPDQLQAALTLAQAHPRSFVSDQSGTGTTALFAAPGEVLSPSFGVRSRAAHRVSGAVELDLDAPCLRRDVDTDVDLIDAVRLGVGEATRHALDSGPAYA
jgi:2-phospho-L-lactate/phosphoenolpyruvate guanylyltransferase